MKIALAFAALLFAAAPASGERLLASQVRVLDGDTIRVHGVAFRLVGFDTPERGAKARCEGERVKADAATARLRAIVARGRLRFERVRCACAPKTEGTLRCNHGRYCGRLFSRGGEVGTMLIRSGLARPYVCTATRCPPRGKWC